jgi:hypothetical protein
VVKKLRWVLAAMALAVLVCGCAGADVAAVADHVAPEIDAARVAEVRAADAIDVAVPPDISVDASAGVRTAYGVVPPQDASGLDQSAAEEAAAVSDATLSVATDPTTGAVNSALQDNLKICFKAGFISVGKTYFKQWLNGQYDFNSLMSSGISGCLTKTFPDVNPQLISQLSSKLAATIDPSAVHAQQNSPTVSVFQNWLVQAGS